jgi:hypothetical protein
MRKSIKHGHPAGSRGTAAGLETFNFREIAHQWTPYSHILTADSRHKGHND